MEMARLSTDIENLLDRIRMNSVLMSKYHKKRYMSLKETLKIFKIPIIIFSSVNSILSVGLQSYVEQGIISAVVSFISLVVGILGSVELYLRIQENMEVELIAQRDFYLLGIGIYKVLQLDEENRSLDMKLYLEEVFSQYQKLIENSNVVVKSIQDQLTLTDIERKVTSKEPRPLVLSSPSPSSLSSSEELPPSVD
jgi:hypothetical protein